MTTSINEEDLPLEDLRFDEELQTDADEELHNNDELQNNDNIQSDELEQQAIDNLNIGTLNRNDDDLINLKKSDTTDLKAHSEKYGELLDIYTQFVQTTLNSKHEMKSSFFKLSTDILKVIIVCFTTSIVISITLVLVYGTKYISSILPVLLPELISFLTIFIVIPKTIAKYLFNSKEENIMKDIVVSIQNFDKSVREKL